MPELPEVEVIRMGLSPHLTGKRMSGFWWSGQKLRLPVLEEALNIQNNARVIAVKRRAKHLLIELDSGYQLVFHLGMTGNLGLFPSGTPRKKHDHLEWQIGDEILLRYHDPRRFGFITILQNEAIADASFLKNCGPEPFSPEFNGQYLKESAERRTIAIKPFIMTNQIVVGVGNIYANESLFTAGIRPTRSVARVSAQKWQQLASSIKETLAHAITCGGSSISDFRGADQQGGYFQMNFRVYGRAGEKCRNCNEIIIKKEIGGRASFYCPKCQR